MAPGIAVDTKQFSSETVTGTVTYGMFRTCASVLMGFNKNSDSFKERRYGMYNGLLRKPPSPRRILQFVEHSIFWGYRIFYNKKTCLTEHLSWPVSAGSHPNLTIGKNTELRSRKFRICGQENSGPEIEKNSVSKHPYRKYGKKQVTWQDPPTLPIRPMSIGSASIRTY